ncbi:hypothetical protein PR048_024931 [Dryococelus australis]|uniref:Secreted protein n=1 Tax=Dryococelus australis TaxID=614101 RepID=A0ABQ9GPX8_9NEOP|nr:hypothetical protein PR048_024931 [Dryococelus australis]
MHASLFSPKTARAPALPSFLLPLFLSSSWLFGDLAPLADVTEGSRRGVKRGEYGAVPECKDGGNGRSPRKPADQRYRPARFPRARNPGATAPGIERGSPRWEASSLTTRPPRPEKWRGYLSFKNVPERFLHQETIVVVS